VAPDLLLGQRSTRVKARFDMNNTAIDQLQTGMQLASVAAISLPIAFYAAYWVWITDNAQPPSNGRWRYWYTLYAATAVYALVSFLR
jgi:hypothetical protein